MHDTHGAIPFHKVFDWLLPTFGEDGLYEFVTGRMRNYMIHIIKDDHFYRLILIRWMKNTSKQIMLHASSGVS
jgi:hypothetical protein